MEKSQIFINKSLIFVDINEKLSKITSLIDFASSLTVKEIKVYFYCEKLKKTRENFEFYEFLLGFLYHRVFTNKNQDFLFKTSIFFPFLFVEQEPEIYLQSIVKNQKYDQVFIADDEKRLLFLEGNEKIRRFIAKNEEKINDFEDISENNKKKEGYKMFSLKTLAIGGTFDYLHNGHKLFLSCTCLLACKPHSTLTIGLTSTALLQKKQGKALIQSFPLRKHHISAFLSEFHPFLSLNIIELQDPCGPTATEDFEGLVVTQETVTGGDYINKIRQENGLKPLKVYITGLVPTNNQEIKLSSGDIRREFIEKCPLIGEEKINFIEFMRELWGKELRNAGVEGEQEVWFDRLFEAYMEKWRFYHNVMHIWEMLKLFEEFRNEIKEKFRVFMAIWFHDAVYLPGEKENEEQSAILLQSFIDELIEQTESQEKKSFLIKEKTIISDYILITKDHFKALETKYSEDPDLKFFLDFDLAILGASPERYNEYANGVYKEYSRLYDLPTIYKKRGEFLKNTIEKKLLYFSKPLKTRLEAEALSNLQRELSQIS